MAKQIKVFNNAGDEVDSYEINPALFVEKIHNHDMFLDVVAEGAGRRQGTHSTLTKGEVRGGGKKPYKQKHTGNARQGSIRNPHYVGGGVAFGPKPNQNYHIDLNRKVHRLALKSAYTKRINENKVVALVNDIDLKGISTRKVQEFLTKINENARNFLLVLSSEEGNVNFLLSARNIHNLTTKTWDKVSVRDLLANDQILIQIDAFDKIAGVLK